MRPRLTTALAALLTGASVTLVGPASPAGAAGSGRASTASTVEPTTPVFSMRRVADAVVQQVGGQKLQAAIDGVFAQPLFKGAADNTCVAVQTLAGDAIYARQVDKSLIPASNLKLLTADVALDKIGPDARYVTPVKATGPPQNGAVGDLWLVGSGDPLLGTADFGAIAGWLMTPRPTTSFEGLADRIVNAGVKSVGRIIGDESRYDTQRYVPTWEPNYATDPDVGPLSALNLNGGFSQNRPRAIPAAAPATFAASKLADLLRARGISVGGVAEGTAPAGAVTIAQIESPPMSDVVGTMLKDSDNTIAELLVKELGARFGKGGTTAAGLAVIHDTAASLGLPMGGVSEVDGSGLDRSDRATCNLMQAVLDANGPTSAMGKGMSVAGTNGTLTLRFTATPAAGKVVAKTGSLTGVTSLSGWVTDLEGAPLQFSMLANGIPTEGSGTALQDQLVSALASYPQAPKADDIGPTPARTVTG